MPVAIGTLFFASACSGDAGTTTASSESDGLNIVTSTSIWGDVASAVVTDEKATVTPIITGNSIDPHHFDPSAADLAKATEADIVVVGGGGYDAWLYDVVDEDKIVNALPLIAHDHGDHEGHDHGEEAHDEHEGHTDHEEHDHGPIEMIEGNEHIWYDTDAVEYVAEEIEAAATANTPGIEADAQPVLDRMKEMDQLIEELPAAKIVQSESVGDYIIDDSNMEDITPESYRKAILTETEPAASDLAAFLDVLKGNEVDVLLFNPQTATDTAERIKKAAEENDVTIVEINETPEEGTNFLEYFEQRVQALSDAVK
ncbi:zinc ABC transporter substrate-binding protein [Corynebacterium breve]|uniref:Zinc ABC transporter substrate-binding protein n=1 Tax=Corynebacterium breve TaxID=3049799 RepID=A0ABY8VCW4_9CORY|nr:zinc ABC transporter substrate-binding protein [Corynebacterium breve]WIM67333.1 zinc ABC transporter substrate-binding protein [Corynebacterium breve]